MILHAKDLALFFIVVTIVVVVSLKSEINWTTGFTLVGFSFGGGIAAAFCSFYPHLVESLVLIGPGGVLRPTRISAASKQWTMNLVIECTVTNKK